MIKPLIYSTGQWLFCLLLGLLVAGCGFHLRGPSPLVTGVPIAIANTSSASDLTPALARALKQAGFVVTDLPHPPDWQPPKYYEVPTTPSPIPKYILRITGARTVRLTIGGRYSEINLGLNVTYRLDNLDPRAPSVVPDSNVESKRSYQYDIESINPPAQQEAVYHAELLNSVAQQLTQQLLFQLGDKAKAALSAQ